MTPEQINIAIHCALGNRLIKRGYWEGWWKEPKKAKYHRDIPNYHGDLNAIYEAEKTLNPEWQIEAYYDALDSIVNKGLPKYRNSHAGKYAVVSADSAQRSEAFVRTIGKWEDTTP